MRQHSWEFAGDPDDNDRGTARADVLDDVKKRGTLVVGVKADYKPFGFRDPSGSIVGLEPDLAANVERATDRLRQADARGGQERQLIWAEDGPWPRANDSRRLGRQRRPNVWQRAALPVIFACMPCNRG